VLPHVDTFKIIDGQVVFSTLEDKYKSHNQYEEKVSLQYYRDQSKLIFSIIRKHCTLIEKGGTDEAYIQVTAEDLLPFDQEGPFEGIVMSAYDSVQPAGDEEILLKKASNLAAKIRQNILFEAQYKSSAGISINKMLAKLGSSTNKPNN
jgi:nucleotidyltransferase/DNA polymerase involved in DNA repair